MQRFRRKLAAILVLGRAEVGPRDEEDTYTELNAIFTETIEPLLAEFNGHLVKRSSGSNLVEFGSVIDAALAMKLTAKR